MGADANRRGGAGGLDEDTRRRLGRRSHRDLRFIFFEPADIPTYVQYGAADLRIVGEDILAEQEPDVYEPVDLGFGHCRLVVTEPRALWERDDPARWSWVRVVTKYSVLTERYFSARAGSRWRPSASTAPSSWLRWWGHRRPRATCGGTRERVEGAGCREGVFRRPGPVSCLRSVGSPTWRNRDPDEVRVLDLQRDAKLGRPVRLQVVAGPRNHEDRGAGPLRSPGRPGCAPGTGRRPARSRGRGGYAPTG